MTDSMVLRRARFRLQRQGMLELDCWLMPLADALDSDPQLITTVEALLALEPSALQQMMEGEAAIPEALKPWLH